MLVRLAMRSLAARPVRTAVLACGFGLGVSVMASLLGIGDVVLEQARAPALIGGGDVAISGVGGRIGSARFVLSNLLGSASFAGRTKAVSPTSRATLYLVRGDRPIAIRARGGVPSLERALDDPETSVIDAWQDAKSDAAWTAPRADDVLRAMDRFHPIPNAPTRRESWAEWLYFNGRAGDTRFYVTFLAGPARESGRRTLAVRLQLDENGVESSFSESAEVDGRALLAAAPDLTVGGNRVRLDQGAYRLTIDLPLDAPPLENEPQDTRKPKPSTPPRISLPRAVGEIVLAAAPGRSLPPLTIRGAGGWLSGYVVPVTSGALSGALDVDGRRLSLAGGTGYHDHNWGFWEGVTWQWGQVQADGLSLVYGRVFPPADAADVTRVPGFVGVFGPDGPLGSATDVSITETTSPGADRPSRITVVGRSESLDLTMDLELDDAVTTRMRQGLFGGGLDFLQLRATYRVRGRIGDRTVDFTAPGAAETFRGLTKKP